VIDGRLAAGVLAVTGAGLGGGCTALTGPAPAEPARLAESLDQSRVLDIQVFRDGTELRLTNTTARRFEPGRLWINRSYSVPTPALDLGESISLDLRSFVNEHGDRFRAGGFFATREPDLVVLAQLESGGELFGLVIVENRLN
jgi:hypothetical protein